MASRRLRAFKRWMKSQGIECSDALELLDSPEEGISVRALCDLKKGDVVAKIPKKACLTIKTSGACEMIESARLDGCLGLSVALMYERSLGEASSWAGYLQLLPHQESLPFLWSVDEVDSLLRGTELHKTVKEDKALIYEDWKESILPLMDAPLKVNKCFFGVEEYFAAKSLVASRSFEVDEYHGFGMVPLADLFNHKTGAEDVHFTSSSSHYGSDNETEDDKFDDDSINHEDSGDEDSFAQNSLLDKQVSAAASAGENFQNGSDTECSSTLGDDPAVLEMIMVKDVKIGAEVFNTYGLLGNAALLHRYGFTEPNNQYDIVNIDLELVLQWSSSFSTSRYSRSRLSLWRRLDYSGCVSQNSEYFEISSDGEPQIELLVLLYIMLLQEDVYHKVDHAISMASNKKEAVAVILSRSCCTISDGSKELSKIVLLTKSVCGALLALADMRESLYGSNSIEDDIEALNKCSVRERKLYHSLILRVSERKILEKLRSYASCQDGLSAKAKKASSRKPLKCRGVSCFIS